MQNLKIIPVVLAGGKGSRLWPLSREDVPKQFCRLDGALSLFQKTIKRVQGSALFSAPVVVTGNQYIEQSQQQLRQVGCETALVVSEPCGRDTSAAILLAAELCNAYENQLMLVMPSDHHIEDEKAFMKAVEQAALHALHEEHLITFGIRPSRAETGFGYLRAGAVLPPKARGKQEEPHGTVHQLLAFIEKPDKQKAEHLVQEDNVFWNAGIFLFNRAHVKREFNHYAPQMSASIQKSVLLGDWRHSVFYPEKSFFNECEAISFDYAIMEKTKRAALMPINPGWSDLGSWSALWEMADQSEADKQDNAGNVASKNCYLHKTQNSYVFSDGPTVAVTGLDDVIVVANKDAVLVTLRNQDQGVKNLVEEMKSQSVSVAIRHDCQGISTLQAKSAVQPWGRWECLDKSAAHKVGRMLINPQKHIPLQHHQTHAQNWTIVKGTAHVLLEGEFKKLQRGEQISIPKGGRYRVANETNDVLEIIAIQTKEGKAHKIEPKETEPKETLVIKNKSAA